MTDTGTPLLTHRFSLRVKGMVVLAIPVVALLAAVIAVLSLERGMRSADELVRRALVVRSQLQEVQWLLMGAQTGLRGYLLTGDDRFRVPYERAVPALESSVARLSAMASVNGTPSARMRAIEEAAREELDLLRQLRLTPAGSRPDSDLIWRSQKASDRLQSLLEGLWADLDRLFDVAGHTRLVRYQQFSFVALVCVVIGPFGGLLLNVFLSDRLVRRVREVGLNAHRLATGQPLKKLPPGTYTVAWRREGSVWKAFEHTWSSNTQ